MDTIAVCVCTFQREALLEACLSSVAAMALPASTAVHVVVIDNDAQATSRDFVESLRGRFPLPLHYECEPRRGIPCARNRAIEVAHALKADYFVFIDDDERVEPNWLVSLADYCREKGGQAVIHGAVEPMLPEGTPAHIQAVYQKKNRTTGERLSTCATNNVMVPVRVTQELNLRFDERNPLAGGTDTIFFTQAAKQGIEIYECREALVRETIPASRATLGWLSKRKYRAGITEAWRKRQGGRSGFSIVLSALLQCLVEGIKAGVTGLCGLKHLRNRFWLKACRSAGVIAGMLGAKVDSYRKIDS